MCSAVVSMAGAVGTGNDREPIPRVLERLRHTVDSGKTRMRNIAIYDDKVFHITKGEPHLIAVNARTGELVWEVPLEGSFSSGPIVVDGKVVSGRSCSPVPSKPLMAFWESNVWRLRSLLSLWIWAGKRPSRFDR